MQIQRPVLLTVIRTYRTAPTSALQVLAGLSPLEYLLDMKAKLCSIKNGRVIDNGIDPKIWRDQIGIKSIPGKKRH